MNLKNLFFWMWVTLTRLNFVRLTCLFLSLKILLRGRQWKSLALTKFGSSAPILYIRLCINLCKNSKDKNNTMEPKRLKQRGRKRKEQKKSVSIYLQEIIGVSNHGCFQKKNSYSLVVVYNKNNKWTMKLKVRRDEWFTYLWTDNGGMCKGNAILKDFNWKLQQKN